MATSSHRQLANAIRALSMDAVEKAKSGHPGAPMGMADIAEVLWNHCLRHDPTDPNWLGRDRFVLSNGHASMLLYSLLHLSGYKMSLDDIKNFRQLHSKTPGHPEFGCAEGVETTTGPLGQGLANAVGMALSEAILANTFNKPNFPIIDNWTYVFVGDGCLMEGISHEACSMAGTLGLGKLIAFWDDNGISIDGPVKPWFNDNTALRFKSYGWQVIENVDGHDAEAIKQAIASAKSQTDQPTLICCKTTIGFGAPNAEGKEQCHGAPLGEQEVANARKQLNWSHPAFEIPKEIYAAWDHRQKGQQLHANWDKLFAGYQKEYPELAEKLQQRLAKQLPVNWSQDSKQLIAKLQKHGTNIATRKASQQILEELLITNDCLFGGSADLSGSNLTLTKNSTVVKPQSLRGNYLHFGVREFAMAAITNGMSLYGGFVPYTGTFLTFVDYAKNAVRLAALMNIQNIFVLTHDSIGLGEDGPTHQPVEQIAMLRATPNLHNWRPCDDVETAVAWSKAIERQDGPTTLILSRQSLNHQQRTDTQVAKIAKGGYILRDCDGDPDVILIATGSEVQLCIEAANQVAEQGVNVRVVSMPCVEEFKQQEQSYQDRVLPPAISSRIAIEAAASLSWHQFVGVNGKILALDKFGESAPSKEVMQSLGFNVEKLISLIKETIDANCIA